MSENSPNPSHFKGKDAVGHVVEAQARGIIAKAEAHGEEIPGSIAAASDTARETAILLSLVFILFSPSLTVIGILLASWILWRFTRSASLSWSRLERLHRLVAEEKWEIDHHRDQERAELSALYEAKGFKGKLLEDVMDVLMSDEDRLLRVMLEEELGLSLECQEHPLQLGIGAALGAIFASALCLVGYALHPIGLPLFAAVVVGAASYISATYNRNKRIPAVVWNLGLYGLTIGLCYTLLDFTLRIT